MGSGLTLAMIGLTEASGQSLLIPSTTRRDLVFDYSGQNLYISNSTGIVRTFNLSTLTFGTSYDLGGSLNGLDIARDNSFLLVAQDATSGSQGTFHKVDLATGMVTNINYTLTSGETGAWDVAIGSNGLALVTTRFGGSGSGSAPPDRFGYQRHHHSVGRSRLRGGRADRIRRSIVAPMEPASSLWRAVLSNGPSLPITLPATLLVLPYIPARVLTTPAGPSIGTAAWLPFGPFASPTSLNAASDFNFVHSFDGIDGGVAFDASSDILYGVNTTTDQIIAYNTQTFAELFRLNIGEDMSSPASTQFGTGVLVASADGHWLALETPSGIRLFSVPTTIPTPTPTPSPTPTPTPPPDGNVLIPSAIRRDLVFDFSGQNLYISNSTGTVRTFNLSTLSFGTTYELGGSLNGLDIARDNSFLLVAQNATSGSQGTFHKVDLATGMVTNINYTRASGETGAWDVAIGSNGLALVTTRYAGSGWVPLRQINLTTNAISIRSDAPGSAGGGQVGQDTQISRSADGTRLFLQEGNISTGPIFTYSAISNSFGPHANATDGNGPGAVNGNGTLVSLRAARENCAQFQLCS